LQPQIKDLQSRIQQGLFREDLFYRVPLSMSTSALRERAEDIGLLASFF
jgi:DNA-binding NtrC family response regulator